MKNTSENVARIEERRATVVPGLMAVAVAVAEGPENGFWADALKSPACVFLGKSS